MSDEQRFEVEAGDPVMNSFHVVDRWFNQKTVLTYGGHLAQVLAETSAQSLSAMDDPEALLVELLPMARVSMGQDPINPDLPMGGTYFPQPDPAAIRELVEGLTYDEYGRARLDTGDAVAALAWECPSCRPDVGWPEHAYAERLEVDPSTGLQPGVYIGIEVECGHCGYAPIYDLDGNLDEVRSN